jgi:hypothetical protein
MALISQRVAAGLEIKPIKRDGLHQRGTAVGSLPNENGRAGEDLIDWKKWGNRIALGKSAVSVMSGLNPVRRNTVQKKHSEILTFYSPRLGFNQLLKPTVSYL